MAAGGTDFEFVPCRVSEDGGFASGGFGGGGSFGAADMFYASSFGGGDWSAGGGPSSSNGYGSLNSFGLGLGLGAVGAGFYATQNYLPGLNALAALAGVANGAGTYNSASGDGRWGTQEGLWDGVGVAP